jgi:uncharacterized protein
MNRQDWALLAISVANGRGLSAVQLQKALFLLERGVPTEVGNDYYNFKPYNYGPFDSRVYTDADQLSLKGLITVNQPTGRYSVYNITPEGVARAKELEREAPPRAVQHVRNLVDWIQQLSFAELVRAIYSRYPDMKANSVFNF